jgi:hypothetical protein
MNFIMIPVIYLDKKEYLYWHFHNFKQGLVIGLYENEYEKNLTVNDKN